MAMPRSRTRRNLLFAAGFSGLAAVLSGLGFAAYSWHTSQFKIRNEHLFGSLLPTELFRLERWRAEREFDLRHLALSETARRELSGLAAPRPTRDAAAGAARWFAPALGRHHDFSRVDVFTPSGALVWSSAPARRGGEETILFVEDEPALLLLAGRFLKNAGYRVTAFPEAASALAWASTGGAHFDLLMTDVILPGGKGGKELADALAALRPGLRVLFTSGYSADALSNHGVLAEGTRLLVKPFSEESLLGSVRSALDGTVT